MAVPKESHYYFNCSTSYYDDDVHFYVYATSKYAYMNMFGTKMKKKRINNGTFDFPSFIFIL